MRLLLLSDLHCDEYPLLERTALLDRIRSAAAGCDAVVLAGDVSDGDDRDRTCRDPRRPLAEVHLEAVREAVGDKDIFYVAGNHEHFMTGRLGLWDVVRRVSSRFRRLRGLERRGHLLADGRRIHGATLWYPCPTSPEGERIHALSTDSRYIPGLRKWVYGTHEQTVAYFRDQVRPGDIVVTHMVPLLACVPPAFAKNPKNMLFVGPCDEVIAKNRPAFWLFGHTHDDVDVFVGETRCICAPGGNPKHERERRPDYAGRIIEI
jgi:predicted phosphodiesterase